MKNKFQQELSNKKKFWKEIQRKLSNGKKKEKKSEKK